MMLFSQQGRALQSHLLNGLLSTQFYPGDRLTMEQAAMEYARMAGYLDCFRRLQESTVPALKPETELPADYDQTKPPDYDDTKE